jgi:septal ring factor EnvC (AmiA/AmiB activator)
MMCCGKDRSTNFCPSCGKPMNSEAGLLGLKNYLTSNRKRAEKKISETKRELEAKESQRQPTSKNEWLESRIKELKQTITSADKSRQRWQDWEEALIKAIDGE